MSSAAPSQVNARFVRRAASSAHMQKYLSAVAASAEAAQRRTYTGAGVAAGTVPKLIKHFKDTLSAGPSAGASSTPDSPPSKTAITTATIASRTPTNTAAALQSSDNALLTAAPRSREAAVKAMRTMLTTTPTTLASAWLRPKTPLALLVQIYAHMHVRSLWTLEEL